MSDATIVGGWVLVPRVPTEAMVRAGELARINTHPLMDISVGEYASYSAMLAASPPPPAPLPVQALVESVRIVLDEMREVHDVDTHDWQELLAYALAVFKASAGEVG